MSKREQRDFGIAGALISGSGALTGLSVIFGAAALSPVAFAGAVVGVVACSAAFVYSAGVAVNALRASGSGDANKQSQSKDDGPPPPPHL